MLLVWRALETEEDATLRHIIGRLSLVWFVCACREQQLPLIGADWMRVKQLFFPDSTRPVTPFSCTKKWSETMSSIQHSPKRCTFVWTRICASLFTPFELWSCSMRHPKEHQWTSNSLNALDLKQPNTGWWCYTNRRIHNLKADVSGMDQWERITHIWEMICLACCRFVEFAVICINWKLPLYVSLSSEELSKTKPALEALVFFPSHLFSSVVLRNKSNSHYDTTIRISRPRLGSTNLLHIGHHHTVYKFRKKVRSWKDEVHESQPASELPF